MLCLSKTLQLWFIKHAKAKSCISFYIDYCPTRSVSGAAVTLNTTRVLAATCLGCSYAMDTPKPTAAHRVSVTGEKRILTERGASCCRFGALSSGSEAFGSLGMPLSKVLILETRSGSMSCSNQRITSQRSSLGIILTSKGGTTVT